MIRSLDLTRSGGIIQPDIRNIVLAALLISVMCCIGGSRDDRDDRVDQNVVGTGAHQKNLPSEWALTQRLFPLWRADPAVYAEAARAATRIPKAAGRFADAAWTAIGPAFVAGRVVDVEFNPRSPDSVYAAAATGGVFLSTDGGSSWEPIFDQQPTLSIGDLAVDPAHPNVVYVGTGEANGGHNNLPGAGLFKSVDGGATWSQSGLTDAVSIARVVIDPTNSDRVFAAVVGSYFAPGAERGVYRSNDSGATWQQVFAPAPDVGAIDLVINPRNPDTLYAAMWERVRNFEVQRLAGAGSGVFRSHDGGDTWTRLGASEGLPEGPGVGRIGLAISNTEPDILYALHNDGSRYVGVFKTENGGASWFDADSLRTVQSATLNFGWYFGQIRVHPANPDDAYVLDVRLANTKTGGGTWQIEAMNLHVDFHALAFHPTIAGRLVVGTDGGIGISNDSGATWTEVSAMPTTQFYRVAIDPSDSNRLFGGTQDNGTLMRNPTSGLWQEVLGGDGFAPLIDSIDPNTVYIQSQNGVLRKSVNGGKSSFTVTSSASGIPSSDPRNWSTPVAMDPSNPAIIYYGTNRVYRSTDAALTWQAISPVLPLRSSVVPKLGTVTAISVAPSDPNVIYAGTDDGRLWMTQDPEETWVDVSSGLPERWITEVAIDPTDPLTAYVTFSGLKWHDPQPHVYRTVSGGSVWSDISANLPDVPVNSIVVDPDQASRLFVGSDIGVFKSEDDGGSWQALSTGMPAVAVYDLDIHASSRKLVASSHGRSAFSMTLPSVSVSTSPDELPAASLSVSAWPNPFGGRLTIAVDHEETGGDNQRSAPRGDVRIEILDVQGRIIRTLDVRPTSSGRITSVWDGRTALGRPAAPGVYFLRVRSSANGGRPVGATARVIRSGYD